MFQSVWEDVKREFSYGNMVTQIIIVNVAVFVAMGLASVLMYIAVDPAKFNYQDLQELFSISDSFWFNLKHPWVIFTHMFIHSGFMHILFNMLVLYWFGRITGDFLGNQRILPLYLLGGLAGALVYFLAAQLNIIPSGYALGASAAVLAILVAAATTAPNYYMNLLFIGAVKLKYIAAVVILINLFSIAQFSGNTGGSIAHLGGAAFGWFFVFMLRQGTDLAEPVNKLIDQISQFFKALSGGKSDSNKSDTKRQRPYVAFKQATGKKTRKAKKNKNKGKGNAASDNQSRQERVDAILDKIKQSGYDSLTVEEKEYLFNASKEQ
ncbi:MAG: rhomboid family intramembrane serine protease [Bacteroidota bacterium]